MRRGGLVRRTAYCSILHSSFKFPVHYRYRLKVHLHYRTPQCKKGFLGWLASWDTVIGRNWLTWLTHNQLLTVSLRYGYKNVLRKSQNLIVNHPLQFSGYSRNSLCSSKLRFSWFLRCIFHGSKENVRKVRSWRVRSGYIYVYIFPTCQSLSGNNAGQPTMPWGTRTMETCCAIYGQSGHALDFQCHHV